MESLIKTYNFISHNFHDGDCILFEIIENIKDNIWY